MRESNWFQVSGDVEIDQHVILTNIPVPQESKREIISGIGNYGMGSGMHTRNKEN